VGGGDGSGGRPARRGGRGRGRGPLRGAPARLVITTAITRERSVPWRVPGRGRSVAAQSRATSAGPRPRRRDRAQKPVSAAAPSAAISSVPQIPPSPPPPAYN